VLATDIFLFLFFQFLQFLGINIDLYFGVPVMKLAPASMIKLGGRI
jgi:hypothetical protein